MNSADSDKPNIDADEVLAAAFPPDRTSENFSTSARGHEILAAVHADLNQPTKPKRVRMGKRTGVAIALLALVGTAAAVTTAIIIQPSNPIGGVCLETLDLQANLAQPFGGLSEYNNPAPTCAAQWSQLFPGSPQPANLINCVYPGGGAVFAAPAPEGTDPNQACTAIGAGIPG